MPPPPHPLQDADRDIIRRVKEAGRLVDQGQLVHSYPFCWRSDTPLIYRTVPSWFVRVEDLKPQLLANNALTHWVPAYVKEKRFHNWLEGARDWVSARRPPGQLRRPSRPLGRRALAACSAGWLLAPLAVGSPVEGAVLWLQLLGT